MGQEPCVSSQQSVVSSPQSSVSSQQAAVSSEQSAVSSQLSIYSSQQSLYIITHSTKQINYYINCVGCSNVVCSHLYLLCYLNGHLHANILVIVNNFPAKMLKECWWNFFHQHKYTSASGKMLFKNTLPRRLGVTLQTVALELEG